MSEQPQITWEAAVSWLRSQPDKQEVVRACYFDEPLAGAAERYWRSDEWHTVRSFTPDGKGRALDVGAGLGIASYALARDGWQVTALEPDPSALVGVGAIKSLAQQAQLPIQVVQEFGERLPFEDATFELVFARQVLHHARDLKQLCRELARVLKPGGKVIALRDHVLRNKADLGKFLEAHALHHLYGGENAYLFEEYRTALQEAPLHVEHALRSYQTPLHYEKREIREKLERRLGRLSLIKPVTAVLAHDKILQTVLGMASHFDNRPGALVSFICRKGQVA